MLLFFDDSNLVPAADGSITRCTCLLSELARPLANHCKSWLHGEPVLSSCLDQLPFRC